MSKRFNLGILSIKQHKKIKDLDPNQIIQKFGDPEEGTISLSELSKEVFCIGKEFDESFLKPFISSAFSLEESHSLLNNEDSSFYLISKEGFLAIIKKFKSDIADHLKSLINDTEDAKLSYIFFKLQEWETDYFSPYQIEGEKLSNSSQLEYLMFELVRIYKEVNWEKELVCISRW